MTEILSLSDLNKSKQSFLYQVLAPNSIRCGHSFKVSVSTFNPQIECEAFVRIVGIEDENRKNNQCLLQQSHSFESTDFYLFDFDIPLQPWSFGQYELEVRFQSTNDGKKELLAEQRAELKLQGPSQICLIQLDKPLYRPNEKVRMRAILLHSPSLLPLCDKTINITFKDPKENIIRQFESEPLTNGIGEYELDINEEPLFGVWTVEVRTLNNKQVYSKTFEVLEYNVSGFELLLKVPKKVFVKFGQLKGEVLAKHTFGKPIQGHLKLTIYLKNMPYDNDSQFWPENQPLNEYNLPQMKLNDGKASFDINIIDAMKLESILHKDRSSEEQLSFEVKAEVTDEKSGKMCIETCEFSLIHNRHQVEFVCAEERTFHPGLKYRFGIKVSDLNDQPIAYKTNEDILHLGWRFLSQSQFTEVDLKPIDGFASYELDTPENESQIMFRARFRSEKFILGFVRRKYCSSNCRVQLHLKNQSKRNTIEDDFHDRKPLLLQLDATRPLKEFQVFALDLLLNTLVSVQHHRLDVESKSIEITLIPESDWADKIAVFVLTVYEEGKVKRVAFDKIEVKFVDRLSDNLTVEVPNERVNPGESVDIHVNCESNAVVGLLAIDQCLQLMKTGNDITKCDVIKALEENQSPSTDQYFSYCYQYIPHFNQLLNGLPVIFFNNLDEECPDGIDQVDFVPRLYACGLTAEKKMTPHYINPVLCETKPVVQVRRNFPETWIWSLKKSDANGLLTLKQKVPDSITSWLISAFALHPTEGLALLDKPTKLTVFKPFFVNLILPFVVKRYERIRLQAIVFNYENFEANVSVCFKHRFSNDCKTNKSPSFESTKQNETIIIPSNSSDNFFCSVSCDQVGWLEVCVAANNGQYEDQVVKRLFVRPEGEPQYESQTKLIHLSKKAERMWSTFKFEFPISAIADSKRIQVSVNGDLLGKTLDNLNRLVRVPCGCGEQNMINFVPNCLIYTYLNQLQKLKPEIKLKLIKNAHIGYERQLKYQRKDGSFSAFGESDSSGSTWLTAFVVKSFVNAHNLCSIDLKVIERAIDWLTNKQNSNGSYEEVGFVHDRQAMGAMSSQNETNLALSAYVLIAMYQVKASDLSLENEPQSNQTVKLLEHAIESDSQLNCYTLVLICYALHLLNSDLKEKVWNKVWQMREESKDGLFWSNQTNKKDQEESEPSSDVIEKMSNSNLNKSSTLEITSYTILIMLIRTTFDSSVELSTNCFKAISFLIANQNEFGAFFTTQDTVIGLEALGSFASRFLNENEETNLLFKLMNESSSALAHLQVNERNKMNNQLLEYSEFDSKSNQSSVLVLKQLLKQGKGLVVKTEVEGHGLAVLQVTTQYNTNLTKAANTAFQIVIQKKIINQNELQMLIQVKYMKATQSNMVLVELELPSGYEADVVQLRRYQKSHSHLIQRVETKNVNQTIVFYFESLSSHQSLNLKSFATEVVTVSNRKAALIRVYDYYNEQDAASLFYSI